MRDVVDETRTDDGWRQVDPEAERLAEMSRAEAGDRAHEHARGVDPLREEHPVVPAVPPAPRKAPFALALLAAAGLIGLGGWHHWQRHEAALETQAEVERYVPEVRTTPALRDDAPMRLTLPGETQAFDKAEIFARATGYVGERKVDIGSRVHKGDLLLRIAAPDLDQQRAQAQAQLGQIQAQLAEARANVDQATANVTLADVTDTRTATLAGQGWASKQIADQTRAKVLTANATLTAAEARVKVAEASVQAQQATVDRLKALTAFEDVIAPFDGVITDRRVDVGDLVHADSKTGTPLFDIESDAVLRVSVQVPQAAAVGIHDGVKASVSVPQMPGRRFAGTVSRSSVALRSSARTLDTEIDLKNPDGILRPGLYVAVSFDIPRTHPVVSIPSEALIFDAAGTRVAIVQPDDTVRLKPIQIARDLGATLELRDGLEGGERLVLSPPADLSDGEAVTLRQDTHARVAAQLGNQVSAE